MVVLVFLLGAIFTAFGGWAMLQYLNQNTDSHIHLWGGLFVAVFGVSLVVNTLFG